MESNYKLDKMVKIILILYPLFSMLLSISIVSRFLLQGELSSLMTRVNVCFYWAFYAIIPTAAIVWILYELCKAKTFRDLRYLRILLCFVFAFLGVWLMWLIFFESIFHYLLLWLPVPIALFTHSMNQPTSVLHKKKTTILAASLLIISILLPNVAVYVGVNGVLSQAASRNTDLEKASFISGRVNEITAFGLPPRAKEDYWMFLMSGTGHCREMAIACTNLMKEAGLESRRVAFPGEDHALVEVKIDGEWLVSDSGYYGYNLLTRAERAAKRIQEIGSLSYVVALTETSFIELTEYYVNIDTIIFRITSEGKPLADTEVVLKHKFGNLETQLPCDDCAFHTDVNGTVTLHMGELHYVNAFAGSEEYYWVYVNGKNTGYKVTSTGTGITQLLEIELPK